MDRDLDACTCGHAYMCSPIEAKLWKFVRSFDRAYGHGCNAESSSYLCFESEFELVLAAGVFEFEFGVFAE